MAQNYNAMDELQSGATPLTITPGPDNEELLHSLMQQLASLTAQVARLSNPPAVPVYAPAPVKSAEPKCADPEPFKGDKKELTTFLVKCRLKFEGEPSRFSKEDAKIRYACGYLGGDVFKWIVPMIQAMQDTSQPNPPELESFEALAKMLTKVYGDPNIARNARRELRALSQTGSVATYIAKFGQLTPYVDYNNGALMDQFLYGLKEEIKDEVARVGYFNTLAELQDFAVRLDSRLYDRQLQKRNLHANPTLPPKPNFATRPNISPRPTILPRQSVTNHPQLAPAGRASFPASSPDGTIPMEIDAQGRRHITREENERRKRMGLCTYCAQPGHDNLSCPIAPPAAWKVSALEVEIQPEPEKDPAEE